MAVPPPPHPRQGPPHPSFFGMEQMKMEIKLEPEQEQGGSGGGAVAGGGLNSLWPSNGKFTEYLCYAMTMDNSVNEPKYFVGNPLSVEITRLPNFQVDIVANGIPRINLFNSGEGHTMKSVHVDLKGPMYTIRMLVKEQNNNKSHILQYYSGHQQDKVRMGTIYDILIDIKNSML